MAQIGTVIDNKYEVLKQIGQGGMSTVYLAMDKRLNKQWAIKEIKKQARDKNAEIVVQSLIAEANLMKKLDHPALPRIVDIIDNGETIYVIMDYIEGEALTTLLEEYGAQPQDVVIEWAKQLCRVLDYLHSRTPPIVYRDMKPANIMLRPDGQIKLIDFGIAREYKEQNLSDTVSLGTRGYAAPEQFGGKGQTDPRTDIYCLGVTLYHLVTGHNPTEPPYELYPIRHWNPNLSGGLETIILKATALNPEDRYQSCPELFYALQHFEEFDEVYRRRQKRKLHFFIGVAGAAIIFAGSGFALQSMAVQTNNNTYEQLLIQGQNAHTPEEAAGHYLAGISAKPYSTSAYDALLAAYKDDAAFSVQEESQLKIVLNEHLQGLRQTEEYPALAFELGKLYWYYYDYGKGEGVDNGITRMKSAIPWFEDVLTYGGENNPNYLMAKTYAEIGKFNRDITLNIEEASDKGLYRQYWDSISSMTEQVSAATEESEIVRLEFYKLVLHSLETYARKFKADDIPQEELEGVYQQVKQGISETESTTDKTIALKEYLQKRLTPAQEAVKQAYRKEGA